MSVRRPAGVQAKTARDGSICRVMGILLEVLPGLVSVCGLVLHLCRVT
jgi:hypothetical protein